MTCCIPFSLAPTHNLIHACTHAHAAIPQGMLCADVIGFHAFDHARHFLNACKRILGLSYFNKSG